MILSAVCFMWRGCLMGGSERESESRFTGVRNTISKRGGGGGENVP